MCMTAVRKAAIGPIFSGTGRAFLAGGATGVALRDSMKKKKPAAAAPPVLEPTESLRNSSLFNSPAWGG